MEKDVTLSTRVTSELAQQVQRLCDATRRSRSWILEEALSRYVESEMRYIQLVQEGLDDVAAGRVVSHEEVMAEWEQRKKQWQN